MYFAKFEGIVYWIIFVAVFMAVAIWESRRPRRPLGGEERRWTSHGALLVIGYIPVFLFCRIGLVTMAVLSVQNRFGLFNLARLPAAARWILALLTLDLMRFALHWAHHSIPLLWRIHQIHHTDPDFDVSTSVRFHPIEIVSTQTLEAIRVRPRGSEKYA